MTSSTASLLALLPLLLPVIVGIATRYAMAGLKRLGPWIDRQPAWLQQGIVLAIATLLGFASAHGIDLCAGATSCHGVGDVTAGGLTTLIGWIIAMVTHNGKKVSAITAGQTGELASSTYRPTPRI